MLNWLKQIFSWIIRFFRWLWSGKFGICITLSYPLVLIFSWFIFPELEAVIRTSGLLFQILGIATVVIGIIGVRKLFGSASIVAKIKSWAGNFPKFSQDTHINVISGNVAISPLKGRGHLISSSPENASLEEKVAFLEKTVEALDKQIYQVMRTIEDNQEKVTREIQSERVLREANDDRIKELLKDAITGDLILEEVGILWLLVGIVLATASKEISCWLI